MDNYDKDYSEAVFSGCLGAGHSKTSPDNNYAYKDAKKGDESHQLNIVSLANLLTMKLPLREEILSPWLMTQSLSMIHGWRGVGKTHTSLGVSYAVASGGEFLNWSAKKARKVMFIDGEMPAPTLQQRLAAIKASNVKQPSDGYLSFITPDLQTGAMPDLASYSGQDIINAAIISCDAELIVIDNLSCLVRGAGRENDAESWVAVSEWALMQRQNGRSVLFIHHSGKNGQQRGTSKREDLLDVVIGLRRTPDYDPANGACFEVHFEKARHLTGDSVNPIEAKLSMNESNLLEWHCQNVADSTYERVVSLANEGLSQIEIANELDIHRSNVSRAWRNANKDGKLLLKVSSKGRNQYAKASKG